MDINNVLKKLNKKLPRATFSEYDKMAEYPYINSALVLYTEEILQRDPETQTVFAVEGIENKKALSFLADILELSDFENLLEVIVYNTCKYGEFGVRIHEKEPYLEVYSPKDYDFDNNTVYLRTTLEEVSFDRFQIFGFYTDYEDYPRGTSILKPARKIFQRLKLLEDTLVIYRLTRAPQRFVYYIPVGDMTAQQAAEYIKKLANERRQRSLIDPKTGTLRTEPNTVGIEDDIWIPEFEGGKSARVEVLAGASNVSDIADIEYMLSQLFGALRIPKAYLGNEYDVNRATLVMQDIKFARGIKRYQGFIRRSIEKLFFKLLRVSGFDEVPRVKMFFPNIEDMQRIDYLLQKADLIDRLSTITLPSGKPLLSDEEIKQLWSGKNDL